jgi:protein-tyrosine phosphatase
MARLREAWNAEKHPRLILSAEVAYMPGMADWEELDELCYENTRTLLVEPPQEPWNGEMIRQLYAIEGRRGITPMIAHLDRYLGTQTKARIEELLETGFPVQVSAAALLQLGMRRKALSLLTDYGAVLVSDCHNLTTRPPNIGTASKVLVKRLGVDAREFCRMPTSFLGGEDDI